MKVGFRQKKFNSLPIVKGRERVLIIGSNERRKSLFAICELDSIIASHNEKTFGNSDEYPLDENGRNVNDRNYTGDENAQAKVKSVAQNLEPNIIISTSATSSGTPIITVDGIVVSGNNRVMSLKLMKSDYAENSKKYLNTLYKEIDYGGYGNNIKFSEVHGNFKFPVLVRIDLDFKEYNSTELNKYNTLRSKSEKQIDKSIRISQLLKKNMNCQNQLIDLINEQEMVSELYNNIQSVSRFKKILINCNLITDNDVSALFTSNSLTEQGKLMYNTILLSLVLNEDSLEISQNDGIKSYTKNVVNAILPLIKNKSLIKGSLISYVNKSFLVQNDLINTKSSFNDYIKQTTIEFDGLKNKITEQKPLIMNSIINENSTKLKNTLLKYNSSMEQNIEPDMFGEQLSEDEIFNKTFAEETNKISLDLIIKFSKNKKKEIVFKDKKILPLKTNDEILMKGNNNKENWLLITSGATGDTYSDKQVNKNGDYLSIAIVFDKPHLEFMSKRMNGIEYYPYRVYVYENKDKYSKLIEDLKKEYDYPLIQDIFIKNEDKNNHSMNDLILINYFGSESDKEVVKEYYNKKQKNKEVDLGLRNRVESLSSKFHKILFNIKENKVDVLKDRLKGLRVIFGMESDKNKKELLKDRIIGLELLIEN